MKFEDLENRRQFLRYLSVFTAGMMMPVTMIGQNQIRQDRLGEVLPTRKLGNTNVDVTMLGVGGYHIGWTTEKDAQGVIETALEGGIRFFDTAESYGPHTSEIRYGKYLTPKYRDDIFLMTKTYSRKAAEARKHLEESLKRMKTDHLDLWQMHSLESPEDVDERIADGFLEVMLEAKKSGKARHVGFTGHANPNAHAHMLEMTKDNPIFETIQMPINVVDFNYKSSFIKDVLPTALDRNLGIIAMKTLADGRFFADKKMGKSQVWSSDDPVVPDRISIQDALYFAWSLPISVLVTGAETATLIKEKIELAKKFIALSESERLDLVNKVIDLAEKGDVEYYKNV
jgi:aryl-alcohol dehydrogenase-like predicted oxidoreductase